MSDSDRTVDSDELEEFIKTNNNRKDTPKKLAKPELSTENQSKAGKAIGQKLKRSFKAHAVSDSESDEGPKELHRSPAKKLKTLPNAKVMKVQKSPVSKIEVTKTIPRTKEKQLQKIKNDEIVSTSKKKPLCKYGVHCYRKNPDHLRDFSHTQAKNTTDPSAPFSTSLNRNCEAHHFGFYLTKVHGIPKQFNQDLAFDIKDLLSPSKGKLTSSAQFNYMIDIPWLMEQYPPEFRKCPLTIVHGEQRGSKLALEKAAGQFTNIKLCQAKLEILYGTHHTKMMILLYENGLKVIIHTANLVDSDWFQKTQGIWISPLFPPLDEGVPLTNGESSTKFKSDLIEYLSSYNAQQLDEWITNIKKHDLSQAKVFLIGSIPGRHMGSKKTAFGHLKLRKIMYSRGPAKELVTNKWPIIGQFSSIGSLGSSPEQWLCTEWLQSLSTIKGSTPMLPPSALKLMYPTVDNVRCSLEGYPAGASLPYSIKVVVKQPYLKEFLHQWKSKVVGRSEASPHIKTYMRLSSDGQKLAWFLVTSANLSKAAWGALEKKGVQLMIRSYELGVLFMPSEFGTAESFLVPNARPQKDTLVFPIPYDVPLTPYGDKDRPWIWDIPHVHAPDRNGNKWCPP